MQTTKIFTARLFIQNLNSVNSIFYLIFLKIHSFIPVSNAFPVRDSIHVSGKIPSQSRGTMNDGQEPQC